MLNAREKMNMFINRINEMKEPAIDEIISVFEDEFKDSYKIIENDLSRPYYDFGIKTWMIKNENGLSLNLSGGRGDYTNNYSSAENETYLYLRSSLSDKKDITVMNISYTNDGPVKTVNKIEISELDQLFDYKTDNLFSALNDYAIDTIELLNNLDSNILNELKKSDNVRRLYESLDIKASVEHSNIYQDIMIDPDGGEGIDEIDADDLLISYIYDFESISPDIANKLNRIYDVEHLPILIEQKKKIEEELPHFSDFDNDLNIYKKHIINEDKFELLNSYIIDDIYGSIEKEITNLTNEINLNEEKLKKQQNSIFAMFTKKSQSELNKLYLKTDILTNSYQNLKQYFSETSDNILKQIRSENGYINYYINKYDNDSDDTHNLYLLFDERIKLKSINFDADKFIHNITESQEILSKENIDSIFIETYTPVNETFHYDESVLEKKYNDLINDMNSQLAVLDNKINQAKMTQQEYLQLNDIDISITDDKNNILENQEYKDEAMDDYEESEFTGRSR